MIETLIEGEILDQAALVSLVASTDHVEKLFELGVLAGENDARTRVRFVGVATIAGRTFQFLPKVLKGSVVPADQSMRQVVRALRRYAHWRPTHHDPSPLLKADPAKPHLSAIAVADWLLRDYSAVGLYRRLADEERLSGAGQIKWDRTIDRLEPIFSRRRPIYADVITGLSTSDPSHFVSRLHAYAVKSASERFGYLLGYEPFNLDHETVEPFTDPPPLPLCELRLKQELHASYSDRAIRLIPMLKAWLIHQSGSVRDDLALYGTSSFHNVWEAACGSALSNEVQDWLPLLPKPRWIGKQGEVEFSSDTFRPDIVASIDDQGASLLIADAKYYALSMPPSLSGYPGVNDVAKQVWYARCLASAAHQRGYQVIRNIFVFPGDDAAHSNFYDDGAVEMEGVGGGYVQVTRLPFVRAMKAYANARRLSHAEISNTVSMAELAPYAD